MIEFQPGDIVRVSKPDDFSVSFAKRVKDRDAVVLRAFVPLGSNATTVAIRFLKRNGRGSEFEEFMRAAHVHKVMHNA